MIEVGARNLAKLVLKFLICFSICGALLFILSSVLTTMIGDGSYPLQVSVSTTGPVKVATVIVCPANSMEYAQLCLNQLSKTENPATTEMVYAVKKAPFDGSNIMVMVPFSTQFTSPLIGPSFVISDSQLKSLLVFAILDDGRRVSKIVEIPHRSQSKYVAVTLP